MTDITNEALRIQLAALRARVQEIDCSYGETGGKHCPLDAPCQICILERERDKYQKALEEAAPDWLGDNLIDVDACLKACHSEFAIRLFRARMTLEGKYGNS